MDTNIKNYLRNICLKLEINISKLTLCTIKMIKFDEKDRKILFELDTNSRQSIQQISRNVDFHKNAVRYRIKRLEKLGVIKNYYTVIDSHKLGYMVIKLYTKYQNITSKIQKEIIKYFTLNKKTWVVYSIAGAFDLDVIFWVKSLDEFSSFWEKTLERYGTYFKAPKLFFQMQEMSFKPLYLINTNKRQDKEPFELSGGTSNISLDTLDYQLLHLIASNARIPLIDMVKRLNVSSNIVRYRLKKLRKSQVIQGFRTNIDITKLGYMSLKADLFLNTYEDRFQIINHLKSNPYVVCIMNSLGYSHLEIEFNIKDINHFYDIMKDLMDTFPTVINSYQYFSIIENHKLCWMPEE